MLNLIVDKMHGEFVFELKDTPCLARFYVRFTNANEKEIGDNGYSEGFFNPVEFLSDLVLA